MIYTVDVPERHTARYVVEADSEDDARSKIAEGSYLHISDLEFVETIGHWSEWEIVDVEDA